MTVREGVKGPFESYTKTIECIPRAELKKRFNVWRKANPEAWQYMTDIAFRVFNSGQERWSMQALFEIARYEHMMLNRDDSGFKLNNNWARDASRRMMKENKELRGFFVTRKTATVAQNHTGKIVDTEE